MQWIEPAKLVLDTNVVLDWLVFADPAVAGLARAVVAREIRWLACPAMRRELAHVLEHPCLARWNPKREQALACFDQFSHLVEDPVRAKRAPARCRDAGDQVFVDLAWHGRARWLVTRDKALLALAGQVRDAGLSIVTPAGLASIAGARGNAGPPQVFSPPPGGGLDAWPAWSPVGATDAAQRQPG